MNDSKDLRPTLTFIANMPKYWTLREIPENGGKSRWLAIDETDSERCKRLGVIHGNTSAFGDTPAGALAALEAKLYDAVTVTVRSANRFYYVKPIVAEPFTWRRMWRWSSVTCHWSGNVVNMVCDLFLMSRYWVVPPAHGAMFGFAFFLWHFSVNAENFLSKMAAR